MLIDSGLADTHAAGNLFECDSISEMLHDDVAADGWFQQVNTLMQGFQFFFETFCRHDGRFKVQLVEVFHPLLYLLMTDHIQTSVSYACKKIGFCCLFPKITMIFKKSGEDVVHYILALSIVVQKYGGLPIHLTVMLPEQLFEFP